jgi:hypothetical protein
MFAGEVNPPFGLGERRDESDLAGRVERERSALPGIETPALRNSAFKGLRQLWKNLNPEPVKGSGFDVQSMWCSLKWCSDTNLAKLADPESPRGVGIPQRSFGAASRRR